MGSWLCLPLFYSLLNLDLAGRRCDAMKDHPKANREHPNSDGVSLIPHHFRFPKVYLSAMDQIRVRRVASMPS